MLGRVDRIMFVISLREGGLKRKLKFRYLLLQVLTIKPTVFFIFYFGYNTPFSRKLMIKYCLHTVEGSTGENKIKLSSTQNRCIIKGRTILSKSPIIITSTR